MQGNTVLEGVRIFMSDGREHTITEGSQATGIAENTFSAMLRRLRQRGHTVLRRSERRGDDFTSFFRLVGQP